MHQDNAANVSIADKCTNEFYEADMKHTVKYPRLFLRLLGVWPLLLKDTTTKQRWFSVFLILICVLALFFIIIPSSMELILRKNDATRWIAILTATIYYVSSFLKCSFFAYRRKTTRLCLEHMTTDWMTIESEEDRVIMLESIKFGNSLTVICCVFTSTSIFLYHVINPLWMGETINEYNQTVRPLANAGFDIIFDLQSSFTYEILFCMNCVSGFVSYNAINASCSFTAGFVSHACGQMQVIVSQLENLVDGTDKNHNSDKIQTRLSHIAQCHIRVLSLSSKIEEAVRDLCFVEVVSATLIICMIEYYLVMERSNNNPAGLLTYFISFVSNALNILLYCYIGEHLKEQGHQVGRAAYMIEWYRLSNKTVHDLMMIIIMGNYPPKLTAGRILELSIASFGAILRMSLTYCNMLRAMT